MATPTSTQPAVYRNTNPDGTAGQRLGRAVAILAALGSAGVGSLVCLASWAISALAFDGSPLFGCSDGTKSPDPTAGCGFFVFGLTALVVGGGISYLLVRATQTSQTTRM